MEEKVATIIRNGWQSCAGIGGNFHRNKHQVGERRRIQFLLPSDFYHL